MRLFAPLLLALVLAGCDGMDVDVPAPSSPWLLGLTMAPADTLTMPDSLRMIYREDAARLAVRHINALADLGIVQEEEPVEIPEEVIDFFFHGLVHIYNARDLPARDSVFEISEQYRVRSGSPSLYRISAGVDTSYTWVQAWLDGQQVSGNEVLDSLMMRYGLAAEIYYTSPNSRQAYFNLVSSEPRNLRVIAPLFEAVEGMDYTEVFPTYTHPGTRDLSAEVEEGAAAYRFGIGWGDCPSGCIYFHQWVFVVSLDGEVRLGRSSGRGEPVPDYFYDS